MAEKVIEKAGSFLPLVIIILIGVTIVWSLVIPQLDKVLFPEAKFHEQCLEWFRADPACPDGTKPTGMDDACTKAYNDPELCRKICQNACNPYGIK